MDNKKRAPLKKII